MKIMYIGDVMGEVGLEVIEELVPKLVSQDSIDLVVAQSENVSEGKGITITDFRRLQSAGVDICTGGNWSLHREDIWPLLSDPEEPIIRPSNYPKGTPGVDYKYVTKGKYKVLVVSLLGQIVGKDSDLPVDNPLTKIDTILEDNKNILRDATIVNFHGDYSSEKVVIGHYLDGRTTLVVGDHWHVPTADARVLPNGTAHITDVGMCGVLDSSLGVTYQSILPRWKEGKQTRNILETRGPKQFNAVIVNINGNGLSDSIKQIQKII